MDSPLGEFWHRWCAVALAASLWLPAPPGAAQGGAGDARELFQRGVAYFEDGDFQKALAAFQRAYELRPHHAVRVNMANCFERLGRVGEAIFNYQRFLEEGGDAITPAEREEVRATLRRLRASTGTLALRVEPPDAEVLIDGSPPARAPDGAIVLAAGNYTIDARAPGYEPARQVVKVTGGKVTSVELSLPRAASADASSQRRARPLAESAATPEDALDEGPGQREDQGAPPRTPRKVAAWSLGASGLALGLGSLITGVLALRTEGDFDDAVAASRDPRSDDATRAAAAREGQDLAARADRLALSSDLLLVGALAASGTALVLWLTGRKRDSQRTTWAPGLSTQGANVTLRGRF